MSLIRYVDQTLVSRRVHTAYAVTRMWGLLVMVLASVIAGLVAVPGSWSDIKAATVYPLMLIPVIMILFLAGLAAVFRPVNAGVAAVVSMVNGLQVAGIAVVASRDWLNFAGAGGASFQRGIVGSRLSTVMIVVAVIVVAASVAMYCSTADGRRGMRWRPGAALTGLVVAVAIPILLCLSLRLSGPAAVGQFALWWSLPWAVGSVAAGMLAADTPRRSAFWTVTASVVLNLYCAAAAPVFGFGLRLPAL